jgi:hypothetical protein
LFEVAEAYWVFDDGGGLGNVLQSANCDVRLYTFAWRDPSGHSKFLNICGLLADLPATFLIGNVNRLAFLSSKGRDSSAGYRNNWSWSSDCNFNKKTTPPIIASTNDDALRTDIACRPIRHASPLLPTTPSPQPEPPFLQLISLFMMYKQLHIHYVLSLLFLRRFSSC